MATQILLDNSLNEQAETFARHLADSMTPEQTRAYIERAYAEWETCPPDDFERTIVEALEELVVDELAHEAGMLSDEPPAEAIERARALYGASWSTCPGHNIRLDADGCCHKCESEAA